MIKLSERSNKLYNWERGRGEEAIMLGFLVFDSPNDMLPWYLFNRFVALGCSRCWLSARGCMAASKNAHCIQSTAETEDRRCSQEAQPYQPALTLAPQPSFPQAKPKRQFVRRRWDALPCNAPAAEYTVDLLSCDQCYTALRSCSTSVAAIPNPQCNICCSWNCMKLQPFQLATLSASKSFLLDCFYLARFFFISVFFPLFLNTALCTPIHPSSPVPQYSPWSKK